MNIKSTLIKSTKTLIISGIALLAVLFTGYYETQWAEDNKMVFFIKKEPTLKVEFVNFFTSDSDGKKLHQMDDEERRLMTDFCRYHVGIETELKTQEDLDACENGYYATFKKKPLNYINHESWDLPTQS